MSSTPLIWKTPAEVRAWVQASQQRGHRIALVPTMGFLHDGHLSLMREGGRRADVVAASIFVNPTQFGPKEDLSRYPRDAEGDLAKCASAGVVGVYMPEPSTVYPPGYQTSVNVEEVSQGLDGASRPGHFRGVATVVTKLLALFRPDVALFGEKDYQQLQVISRLARDLELGVEIVGMPTLREADGLAMSSRNSYLSVDERQRALGLSRGLFAAQKLAAAGEGDVETLRAVIRDELVKVDAREDYVAIVDAASLQPLTSLTPGSPARALIAAFMGTTRLIDNVALLRRH
ncbi:MAG: pantoate--beta-alanine ligase [Archangium gephyra]|uniref:Pantothenate synthetase n=1 Tax=Archangium gephyra TaxID=48 RepID=A0A2W5T9B8_9BACT|nr:MAG: pantoate--beta-alanine ligase [Archangium gephyra]